MTVLTVVAAVLIVCLLVFIVVKLMPKSIPENNPTNPSVTESITTETQEPVTKNDVNQVKMPSIVNISENDALIALNQSNLGIGERSYETSNEIKKGNIIRAEYEAGTMIPRNTSVKVVISSGPEKFEMPDIAKGTEQNAAEVLRDYELNYTTEYVFSDEIEQGKIVKTSPEAGTMVSQGDKVVLYISQGPEFKDVVVPSFTGKPVEEAKSEIERSSLIEIGRAHV